jgi:hypothetical protein
VTSPSSRTAALTFALLWTAGLVAQKPGGGGAELTVSVTVTPICTVAVKPGELSAGGAIDVRCRNLAANQPEPIVSETIIESIEETSAPADAIGVVVINF